MPGIEKTILAMNHLLSLLSSDQCNVNIKVEVPYSDYLSILDYLHTAYSDILSIQLM